MLLYILIGVLVVGYAWYVSLISRRNRMLESLSSIEVQLKKRYDLIPNILSLVEKFLKHEKVLLDNIVKLRMQAKELADAKSSNEVQQLFEVEQTLRDQLGMLMIQVEDYPELKSDTVMVEAMQTYRSVESDIAAARRFYNASVNGLRNAMQIFPGNVLARMTNIEMLPFFEIAEDEKMVPNTSELLRA